MIFFGQFSVLTSVYNVIDMRYLVLIFTIYGPIEITVKAEFSCMFSIIKDLETQPWKEEHVASK